MMRHTIVAMLAMAGMAVSATPGFAGTVFDGTYRGASTVTSGSEANCGRNNGSMTRTVKDGTFEYNWNPRESGVIIVTIGDNGAVSGTKTYGRNLRVDASGTATPAGLEIDLKGRECTRHLSLKKR